MCPNNNTNLYVKKKCYTMAEALKKDEKQNL